MNTKTLLLGAFSILFGLSAAQAQINFGERALGAVQKGMTGFTFTDTDPAALSKPFLKKMRSLFIARPLSLPVAVSFF